MWGCDRAMCVLLSLHTFTYTRCECDHTRFHFESLIWYNQTSTACLRWKSDSSIQKLSLWKSISVGFDIRKAPYLARPVALACLSSLTPHKCYVPKYAIKPVRPRRGNSARSDFLSNLFQIWNKNDAYNIVITMYTYQHLWWVFVCLNWYWLSMKIFFTNKFTPRLTHKIVNNDWMNVKCDVGWLKYLWGHITSQAGQSIPGYFSSNDFAITKRKKSSENKFGKWMTSYSRNAKVDYNFQNDVFVDLGPW